MASATLVMVLVFVLDLIAFGLGIGAEQRRAIVSSLSPSLPPGLQLFFLLLCLAVSSSRLRFPLNFHPFLALSSQRNYADSDFLPFTLF
jgi:hypothetical protein